VRVGGLELNAEDVAWLESASQGAPVSRSELARGLCARKRLVDALGRPRVVTARIDLGRHAQAGRIALAEPAYPAPPARRAGRAPPGEEGQTLERRAAASLESLGPLSVQLVRGRSDPWHAAWVRCLERHHYLGSGPLCGAQLRYVVLACEEVVAAASFSSAALQVAARDEFIGWSARARQKNRPLLISQSRFCVALEVANLASHVQGLLLRDVADDWQRLYGYRPVLVESYVDTTRFEGTCYRAANWQLVGSTSGRGRQDRDHRATISPKSVWVYPLAPDWQERLCIEPVRVADADADWAETEWGDVDLGDKRLTRRLVEYGRHRFARPTANLPQGCGSRSATKAAYRLLQHPRCEMDRLLSAHREATLGRAVGEAVVLAIQDTTTLNYTSHPATEGLGPIGNFGAEATLGLHVHSLLLANLAGTPLGLLDVQAWVRRSDDYGKAAERYMEPLETKESRKWLRGYEVADEAARRLDGTRVVVVGDREADIFELLERAKTGSAGLLVRAVHMRRIMTSQGEVEGRLWEAVLQEPVAGTLEIRVPRRGKQPARIAQLQLRFRDVRISKPVDRPGKQRDIHVWAVTAIEAPEAADEHDEIQPIEWLLLTTLPIRSADDAAEKVRWYALRWLIEVYHRTLKSGCKVENRQSKTAGSLMAALAVDAVVAWRVMSLVKLGREIPDVPCTALFEELEWQALCCFIHRTPMPPPNPPSLREAVRMVASLGGFLGRKSDGEPGAQTTWRGIERLTDITATFRIFFSSA
jgi:hypothetical protein